MTPVHWISLLVGVTAGLVVAVRIVREDRPETARQWGETALAAAVFGLAVAVASWVLVLLGGLGARVLLGTMLGLVVLGYLGWGVAILLYDLGSLPRQPARWVLQAVVTVLAGPALMILVARAMAREEDESGE